MTPLPTKERLELFKKSLEKIENLSPGLIKSYDDITVENMLYFKKTIDDLSIEDFIGENVSLDTLKYSETEPVFSENCDKSKMSNELWKNIKNLYYITEMDKSKVVSLMEKGKAKSKQVELAGLEDINLDMFSGLPGMSNVMKDPNFANIFSSVANAVKNTVENNDIELQGSDGNINMQGIMDIISKIDIGSILKK